MKTLTVTDARQKLGYWLKRAERGEEIGVVFGASVFALRKVPIQAADYMQTEYGLTKEEAKRAAERIGSEAQDALASADYLTVDQVATTVAARRKIQRRRRGRKAA